MVLIDKLCNSSKLDLIMNLHISDNLTIEDLQERFNKCYPFLKISFFSRMQKSYKPANNSELINEKKSVGEVRRLHVNDIMQIKSWFTIGSVEDELKDRFGLNVRIFRWSNKRNSWEPTSASEELVMNQQTMISEICSECVA